jgi:hypothetical protein
LPLVDQRLPMLEPVGGPGSTSPASATPAAKPAPGKPTRAAPSKH